MKEKETAGIPGNNIAESIDRMLGNSDFLRLEYDSLRTVRHRIITAAAILLAVGVAVLSVLHGRADLSGAIASFIGSHRYILAAIPATAAIMGVVIWHCITE